MAHLPLYEAFRLPVIGPSGFFCNPLQNHTNILKIFLFLICNIISFFPVCWVSQNLFSWEAIHTFFFFFSYVALSFHFFPICLLGFSKPVSYLLDPPGSLTQQGPLSSPLSTRSSGTHLEFVHYFFLIFCIKLGDRKHGRA